VQTGRSGWNKELLHACELDADGAAIWSSRFVAAPAGFNAYVAWNMRELAAVTGDAGLLDRATELADVIDQQLWNDKAGLWDDRAVVGGDGESIRTPISDGVMPALVTASAERANRALENLSDPAVFGGCPYGPANVSQSDASYDPDAYWRGAAWPNMSYLLWIAATRRGLTELADAIAEQTRAGAVASGWAEYWNPHDGTGHGAAPQSWTSLVATMGDADA
jgi:glycogen debranching enzyme